MGPQVTVSAHAPVEITKPTSRIDVCNFKSRTGVCFWVLNGMIDQIIQRTTAIQGIAVSVNYYYYYYYIIIIASFILR